MARERALTLKIAADAKQAQRELAGLSKAADKHGTQTERAMSKVKGSLLDLGGAVAGLFAFNEFNEAQKVAAQTEAAIRSTGKAANVTADEVEDLSGALSEKAAVDDELIQSGANLLLTFTKVRNEVGEGNDIFNQATETALDLSVALGTDMTSASMMLGKALNDPIKGLTTLGRAGVQFTAQQKEQIRTLAETGDLLGAQKIILAELETQVGGSAEAQATGYDRAKVAAGNLAETVGGVLAPAVEAGAGAAQFAAEQFQGLDRWQQQVALGLGAGAYAWMRWGDTAVATMLNLTGSSRDAAGAVSSVNGAIGKGAAAAAVGLTSYALTYEALESLVDAGPDVADLADDLASVGEGSFDLSDALRNADTDARGMAKAVRLLNQDTSSWSDSLLYQRRNMDLWGLDLKAAKKDLEGFDSAFAQLVEEGNAEEAQEAFAALSKELMDQGLTYTEIVPLFDRYYGALEGGAKQNGVMSGAVGVLTDAMDEQGDAAEDLGVKAGDAYERIRDRASAAEQAIRDFHDEQIGQLSGQIQVLDALQEYGETLFANGITTDINTQKGRENQSALIDYAEAAKQAAADEYARTDSMEAARLKMDEYRLRLVDVMTQAGYTKDEIAFMVEQMGFNVTGVYNMDASGALAALDAVQARIDSLNLGSVMAGISGPYGQPAAPTRVGGQHTPPRASGGPVNAGDWYRVNENGQEFFNPGRSGSVIPVGPGGNAMGGGVTVIVQGSVVTPTDLVDAIDAGLAAKQRAGSMKLKVGKANLVGVF